MAERILTQEQVDVFHRDGFIVVRQLIPAEMVKELAEDYDWATRGEYDVPVWEGRIEPGKTLQLENTIIAYTSDQDEMVGDHGMMESARFIKSLPVCHFYCVCLGWMKIRSELMVCLGTRT